MEIKNTQNISFESFYRSSPPCMKYLGKGFGGNRVKFSKALEILDKRCSKHKFFDIFFSQENNSIRIFPKNKSVEKFFQNVYSIEIPEGGHYAKKSVLADLSTNLPPKNNNSLIKKFFGMFSFKKAKAIIISNPYDKLPANVREAVDIIEKIERSIF